MDTRGPVFQLESFISHLGHAFKRSLYCLEQLNTTSLIPDSRDAMFQSLISPDTHDT